MSASGIGPFENDGALDLCDDLQEADRGEVLQILRDALASVIQVPADEYLDKTYGEPAVAAAGIVVARLQGDSGTLEENGLAGLIPEIEADIPGQVARALRRVAGENSEVLSLWEDAGGSEDWLAGIEAMVRAVES